MSAGCGGLYHGQTGNISSPNYPASYPHNTECVWDINVEQGYTVNLTFVPPFDLQAGNSCALDYVEVMFICTINSRYLEIDGTIFYKFKLLEVQINLHFG